METAAATLLVVADDYGYVASYDDGILEAAAAGAIDAVSVMALREPDPAPLLATGVVVGLHLEPLAETPLERQLAAFEDLFRRPPAHIDGHKHCHAEPGGPALEVAKLARERGIRVRSVDPRHRRLLRCQGVPTPDRLVGRLSESAPALPAEIEAWLRAEPPPGLTEWMVHPGRSDPESRSSYDRGRVEDLELVLGLASELALRSARGGCQAGGA